MDTTNRAVPILCKQIKTMKRIFKNIGITVLIFIGTALFALLLNTAMNQFSLKVQVCIALTIIVGGIYVVVNQFNK